MIVIGVTGTLGAGKGTIVSYLVENKKFEHYSARAFITDEIKKQGLPVNRDTMTDTANEIRKAHGPSFIIESLYKQALQDGHDAVIESVRTPGELHTLRNAGKFYLFAIDADVKLRYERIVERGSETDQVSFEQFVADEEREMTSIDPTKQNLRAVIEQADFVFENSGTLEELHQQIGQALQKIGV